jgi:hypothetical protein
MFGVIPSSEKVILKILIISSKTEVYGAKVVKSL